MSCHQFFPPKEQGYPEVTRDEAQLFVTEILNENLPETYPPSLGWMNLLIQAFHKRLPFQNVTFLSKTEKCCVPSWEEIQRDILKEGKGGLCLSLNVAFAAIVRALGVLAYLVPADYVATNGRSVHVLTVFHSCTVTDKGLCKCVETKCEATSQTNKLCRGSPRLKQRVVQGFGAQCSQILDIMCLKNFPRNSLYVADVGCGFPTKRAINLSVDLGKSFVDSGLEYCFINKGQKYLRLHRTGDDVPEGEQQFVNSDGWRPVFSFALTPQPLSYFRRTMRTCRRRRDTLEDTVTLREE